MPYSVYYASTPPPPALTAHDAMSRLVPVSFSTMHDALHAAALVIRGGQHVWLIDGPGVRYSAREVEERCKPILDVIGRKPAP